ncbi:MAG: response regulator [Treponema sp.]|jgi:two-component system response regulator YesN|nr:response regulator [Treponema sp.]
MYRVLVVDDEEPVLDSYVFMLNGCAGFTLAGKARSGFEALKLIHELEPDLVFMDINIPGLDGLEVIADVHKKFPAMIFVLSTAYERFDLAQRAIPLGVFDYLVKPVSKKTFLATMDTARAALQSREAAPAETETPLQRFMRRTIWKAIGEDEWAAIRADLALPSDRGNVCILESAEAEAVCARLAELVSYKRHCVYDAMLNRGMLLVSGDMSRGGLEELFGLALGELSPGGENVLGLGDPRRGPELYLSCAAALRNLEDRRGQRGFHNREADDDERGRFIQLRRKIGAADPAEMRKLFARIWSGVFAEADFTLARSKMASLIMFLMDDITGCYRNPDKAPLFNAVGEIMALKDIAAWERWSAAAFEKLLNEAALRRSGPLPLVKAIAYIREYYADPALQLGSAAEAALVSPAYLSRLFSDQLGTSFVDYLSAFRIEKSEKLIRESGLSIKETAFAVGYRDPNYFSKIFRKLRGLSPSEFAERVEKTG